MFSFFKKKGTPQEETSLPLKPQVVRPSGAIETLSDKDEAPAPTPVNDDVDLIDDTLMDPGMAIDPVDVSILDEAAILFANEQDNDAKSLIETQLAADPSSDIELWLMLFELYQLQAEKAKFETLALQFVVRFERTAPIWRDSAKSVVAAPDTHSVMPLPAIIDITHTRAFLQQLQLQFKKYDEIALDCQAIQQLAPEGCKLLHQALATIRKSHKTIRFLQSITLETALNQRAITGEPRPEDLVFWLLKLEFLQWQNDQEAFENAAVDFAITYEVSPPSWEPVTPLTPPARPAYLQTQAIQVSDEDQFVLSGTYTAMKTAELDKLLAFATDRPLVSISCLKLERVDFVAGGHLLHLIVQLQQQGKEIHLRHVSHLVGALFRVLDMQAFCRIHYRK